MKKHKKAQPKLSFMAQFFQDKADEEKAKNIRSASIDLESKEYKPYEPNYD